MPLSDSSKRVLKSVSSPSKMYSLKRGREENLKG